MSTNAIEDSVAVLLTQRQLRSTLWALAGYQVETKAHISRMRVEPDPQPTDTCCAAHRHRWQQDLTMREGLMEREQHLDELVTALESTLGKGPNLPLDALELIYQDSNGVEYEQPLSDLTQTGTLIDPDTGDDLDLIGVRVVSGHD